MEPVSYTHLDVYKRQLEMLYKHLGLGDGAKTEGVVIVDSES